MRNTTGSMLVGGLVAASALLTGCAFEALEAGDESLGEAEDAVVLGNALSYNALSYNALSYNALSYNALSYNALSPAATTSLRDPGSLGVLARQAMRYTVSCALAPDQSFTFSWTDSKGIVRNETYWGELGLAEHWQYEALNPGEERWISACLIARVNYTQTPVLISSRGTHPELNHPSSVELTSHAVREGAFWGNLFQATPVAYACSAGNDTYARQQDRECASGHLAPNGNVTTCGIIQLAGPCSSLCGQPVDQYGYYPNCGGSNAAITAFLD